MINVVLMLGVQGVLIVAVGFCFGAGAILANKCFARGDK